MDIVDYIKAVKKNYDDSPVYDTKKFFLKNMPQDVPVEDDFVPVMPEGRGLPNPETRIKELATGGRIKFASGSPGILRGGRASKLSAEEKRYINKRFFNILINNIMLFRYRRPNPSFIRIIIFF